MWSSVSLIALAASQAELAQVVAQRDERLLVELAGEVERAVEKDLGLADALEQRGRTRRRSAARVEAARRRRRARSSSLSRNAPATGASVTATRSCACSSRIGRRVEERGEHAVDLGARQLLGVVGAGGEAIGGVGSRSQLGDPHFARIAVQVDDAAVAAHLQALGGATLEHRVAGELARPSTRSRAACRTAWRSARSGTARPR